MENFDQLSAEELMEVKGGVAGDTIVVNCTVAGSGVISKDKVSEVVAEC